MAMLTGLWVHGRSGQCVYARAYVGACLTDVPYTAIQIVYEDRKVDPILVLLSALV